MTALRCPMRTSVSLVLLAFVGLVGCQDIRVTAVEVGHIAVNPDDVALLPGGTVQLSATVGDGGGNLLSERSLEWTSDDPAVAQVDANGLVEARSEGVVRVRASAGGVQGHATVRVLAPARILLSRTTVRFTGVSGDDALLFIPVTVSNGGGGILSGLRSTVSSDGTQSSEWLDVELMSDRAPTDLLIRARAGRLSAGVYSAEVLVSADQAGPTPAALTVDLTVVEAATGGSEQAGSGTSGGAQDEGTGQDEGAGQDEEASGGEKAGQGQGGGQGGEGGAGSNGAGQDEGAGKGNSGGQSGNQGEGDSSEKGGGKGKGKGQGKGST